MAGRQRPAARRIVVGIDGSPRAADALRWAVDAATGGDATLEVVVAWSIPHLELMPFTPAHAGNEPALRRHARAVLDTALLDAATMGDAKVEGRLVKGDPARVLLDAATHADAVVVGCRGHSSIVERVLGSTSHALLARCPAPLVIVPSHQPGS